MYDWVEVEFEFNKGFKGNNEEPPEPEEVEIIKVKYNGITVDDIVDYDIVEQNLWKVIANESKNY